MAKYATNVSGAILLPSSIQVTESISGSVVPLAMFSGHLVTRVPAISGEKKSDPKTAGGKSTQRKGGIDPGLKTQ